MLYRLSYPGVLMGKEGIEPPTLGFFYLAVSVNHDTFLCLMLYQLSYFPIWCDDEDLNLNHSAMLLPPADLLRTALYAGRFNLPHIV